MVNPEPDRRGLHLRLSMVRVEVLSHAIRGLPEDLHPSSPVRG